MAGPRQKKKQRSSRSTVKTGTAGRTKAGKKKVNFLGNEIIAKNWDRKLTLAQNYERLGLSVRLNNRTGGVEKRLKKKAPREDGESDDDDSDGDDLVYHVPQDSLRISSGGGKVGQIIPSEVAVERDPKTGAILRIVGEEEEQSRRNAGNPLNDLLNRFDDDVDGDDDDDMEVDDHDRLTKRAQPQSLRTGENNIVQQLEAQAAAESEEIALKKKPRQQSAREEEWISALVEAHGDDYAAMFRDRKLNPRQQSVGDIKKRIKKWQVQHGSHG